MCVEWKELRCALRGVSAYKQLTGAPELALMGQLLDALEAGRGEEALDRYTQLFYTLKEGNYAGLGAWLATGMEVELLRKLFGGFLVAVGLKELLGRG